ncbi:MAG: response regulator [Bdellovibrio sp.]|jgi:two-component system chemotaxis response regulator CheY
MRRVLIVDDNKTLQKIIARIVASKLHVLPFGSDGNEGVELFIKHRPDLVLLDITMPNCNGKQCLEKILSIDPAAIVIMVSGLSDETTVSDCLGIGAKGFINKSTISLQNENSKNSLMDTIEKFLPEQLSRAA